MKDRTYYLIVTDGGCVASNRLKSLAQARNELKEIIAEDWREFRLPKGTIKYYIEKHEIQITKNGFLHSVYIVK